MTRASTASSSPFAAYMILHCISSLDNSDSFPGSTGRLAIVWHTIPMCRVARISLLLAYTHREKDKESAITQQSNFFFFAKLVQRYFLFLVAGTHEC